MTALLMADPPAAERHETHPDDTMASRNGRHVPSNIKRVRVVIADPDPLARRVVHDAIQSAPGFCVVADATTGREAVELALHYRPEIVVLETTLAGVDAVTVTRQIVQQAPEVRVVMLARANDDALPLHTLRAGASGYLGKDLDPATLPRVLRGVANGEAAVSRSLTMRLIEGLRSVPETGWRPLHSQLTCREWEIVDLLDAGASTDAIAEQLVVSHATVYSHIKSVLRKLGVHSRADAVAAARQLRQREGGLTS